jgi:hypothetical protein
VLNLAEDVPNFPSSKVRGEMPIPALYIPSLEVHTDSDYRVTSIFSWHPTIDEYGIVLFGKRQVAYQRLIIDSQTVNNH